MTLVRPMVPRDVEALVALHGEVLDMEFLNRYGPPFLRTYYRAWIDAPGGIALTAVDERDRVLGGLLGAVDTAQHVHAMLRRHGGALGVRIIARAATHPQLARDLLVTRGRRYARGVVRMLARRLRRNDTSESPEAPRTAEITHVLVAADAQGSGTGRQLVEFAVQQARAAQRHEIVLVTPPDQAARAFYERLGWESDGEVTSRSGEKFVRYRLTLGAAPSDEKRRSTG